MKLLLKYCRIFILAALNTIFLLAALVMTIKIQFDHYFIADFTFDCVAPTSEDISLYINVLYQIPVDTNYHHYYYHPDNDDDDDHGSDKRTKRFLTHSQLKVFLLYQLYCTRYRM